MFPDMSSFSGASTVAGPAAEAFGLAGMGVGAYMGTQAQQGIYRANQNIAADQQQINAQNLNQMKLNARRSQMEVLRNVQSARSLALAGATNQGAQQGSGLQGGYGQISGAGGNNLLGINQNLKIGETIATYNQDITNQQLALSKYQGSASTASGISSASQGAFSLGQGITSYGLGKGSNNQANPNFDPSSSSGAIF